MSRLLKVYGSRAPLTAAAFAEALRSTQELVDESAAFAAVAEAADNRPSIVLDPQGFALPPEQAAALLAKFGLRMKGGAA